MSQLEARAKDIEIYDAKPFLAGKLFKANGYRLVGEGQDRAVEKVFARSEE